jgi:Spy/CpxP family protein refolding chaperone
MNKTKWITAAATALTLTATLGFAATSDDAKGKEGYGHHRGGHHQKGGFGGERFAEKLGLTDAQKQQVQDLQQNFRQQNKAFFDSVRQTREDMRAAKQANDTTKLEALKATMKAQHEQMKQIRDTQTAQIVALLTPEQKAKYDAIKAEREAKRAEHGERGQRGNK